MNRFGSEIHNLEQQVFRNIGGGPLNIDLVLALMDCSVDPREIAEFEHCDTYNN